MRSPPGPKSAEVASLRRSIALRGRVVSHGFYKILPHVLTSLKANADFELCRVEVLLTSKLVEAHRFGHVLLNTLALLQA